MDQVLSYPPSQSRFVCAVAPQGLLPSSPQATFGIGPPRQGSFLNSYTVPLARVVGPQPTNLISNPSTQSFPSVLESPMTHRGTLPTGYNMAHSSLFPSSASTSSLHSAQQYHPLYASYNPCLPSPATLAPFNQTAPFPPMPPINFQDNFANDDPSSTTVFVAGLPACITEETLKTFFQNFGEISYVKIPPHKGYGFVKYVRREDAKQAIIKMNDFPIYEKSRIRLSWGRSLGDKKVEYVKKLSSALGISFESVWKIVQGQDPATIKQIASTVCGRSIGQPYESANSPSVSGLDQQQQLAQLSAGFGSIVQSHTNPMNTFPSVISTHLSSSPIPLHPNNAFADPSGFATRNNDPHFPNRHVNTNDTFQQGANSSCKIEPPAFTSRPKALSQGAGPSSLPPPSWAIRNSWQELFPKDKYSQPVESPVSSINEIRAPEVSTGRRATIPSLVPSSSAHERILLSQRYQAKSPGSAILSSSQASSMDSFEPATIGLRHISNDKTLLSKERDDYHLGCDGFLHGLLEEEGREDTTFNHDRSTFYQAPRLSDFTGEPSVHDLLQRGASSSGTESRDISQNDTSDWPRTFIGPSPTCESETVKNIFNSTPKNLPHSHQTREIDNCKNNSSLGRLHTLNFPSGDGSSNDISKPMLAVPSNSDSQVPISRIPDIGIQSLEDNFWTLSI